jgi:fatty-acyl-CoA synthase
VKRGIGRGDTVAVLAPNVPEVIEAHYGVPMSGGVLLTLNTRLEPATIAYMLEHSDAKIVIVDRALATVMRDALTQTANASRILVIDIDDPQYVGDGPRIGAFDYETLLAEGAEVPYKLPSDEWDSIALSYTSGTTSRPKGVVYHHRGCHLQATDTVVFWQMPRHPVLLWTSPMFHCNGWHYPWTVVLQAGTQVCLRELNPKRVFELIVQEKVTHMGGAPTVLSMLCNAPKQEQLPFPHKVQIITAGAPPTSAIVKATEALGFNLLQMYGLTETFGQVLIGEPKDEYSKFDEDTQARLKARQGVRIPLGGEVIVGNMETCARGPKDGKTMGEILIRGNMVMKGYLKNEQATEEAFKGGWFHSGDLAVMEDDGYIQIKDRAKDVIISGGENISTVEVEEAVNKHPAVMEAAVVSQPHEKWGEVPCAFVFLKADANATAGPDLEQEIIETTKAHLAKFKVPKRVIFGPLPRNGAGKIQKFQLRDIAKEDAAKQPKSKL